MSLSQAWLWQDPYSPAYPSKSPGWHSSTRQIASSVEKRIALALLALWIERLGAMVVAIPAPPPDTP